jgi:hypothetical protein
MNKIDPKILELIEGYMDPKESEKKEFGEVFTPFFFAEEMLNQLQAKVWKNKELKWQDPSSGIGIFAVLIYYKLFQVLKSIIKSDKERSKWIIEKMLFLNEINPANVTISKKIFKIIDPDAMLNITCSNYLKKDFDKKYDIIVGNPPYNKSRLNGTFDSSLYPQFTKKAISSLSADGKLLFVTPSRWFSGGNGLNDFRDFMLKRDDIVLIKHYDSSKTIWPTVDIAGGINYFLIDKDLNNNNNSAKTHFIDAKTGITSDINLNSYDILVQNVAAYPIINKVLTKDSRKLSDIYLSTKYFGINTNSEYFVSASKMDSKNAYNPDKDLIKCYVSKKKGSIKYVAANHIKNPYNFWKVFSPQANGKIGDGFGSLIVAGPNEIASQTFFTFKVKSKAEATSLKSFLESDYANFMLNLRKIDHHINKDTLDWILLPPLNKIWTNSSVNSYFGLTRREINVIKRATNQKTKNNRYTVKKNLKTLRKTNGIRTRKRY